MAMSMSVNLEGISPLIAGIVREGQVVIGRLGGGLRQVGEQEMTESKRRVPVDTGRLRSTGNVQGPFFGGAGFRNIEVRLGYNTDYAIDVHENVAAFHRVGEAKFLESVIAESARFLLVRVANAAGF